jgi:predicted acetyltransferase
VGHIGFEILPSYRGNHLARKACRALRPFIARYYRQVIITADADNAASIRTIQALGAKFLDEGQRPREPNRARKRRYCWTL